MSDLSTDDADLISPDDIGAQIESIFAAQGITPEVVDGEAADSGSPVPDETATGAEAPPAAPVDTEPVEPDPTANLVAISDDLVYDRDQLRQLVQWAESLTPEQQARIDAALAAPPATSGSGLPAPDPYGTLPGAGSVAPGTPGAPVTPAQAAGKLDPRIALGAMAELAPELVDYLSTLQAQQAQQEQALAEYQARQASLAAYQAQQEQAQRDAAIRAGHEAFVAEHPDLRPEDHHYLATRAAELQVMAGLVRQHNGNVSEAYKAAMTTAMWSDPHYREIATQAQVQTFAQQQQALEERRANAASLAGSTGSVPRTPQPAPVDMTTDQRRKAITEAIRQAQSNGA